MASLSHSGISPAISSSSPPPVRLRSEEHTSELQSQSNLVCRLLLEKKKNLPILLIVCGPTSSFSQSASTGATTVTTTDATTALTLRLHLTLTPAATCEPHSTLSAGP